MADLPKSSGQLKLTATPVTSADDPSSQALNEALGSSFLLVRILGVLLIGAFIFSCVFTVSPNEVAVVLRFGKPVGTGPDQLLGQGLHWALPYPIDEIVRIRSGEAKTVRAANAWYATSAEQEASKRGPDANPSLNPGADGYVITSDGNIIHVRATMTYRVTDPLAYIFDFADVTGLLANALNNAIYQAAARFTADAAVYKDVEAFRGAVKSQMAQLIEARGFGVSMESMTVEVSPPGYVKEAFDTVLNAAQVQSRTISDAKGYFDERVLKAVGEAGAVRQGALSVSNRLVEAMAAEAQYFRDQLPAYQRAPGLLRARLRTETLTQILTHSPDKFFLPERTDGQPRELRLQLSREPQTPVRKDPFATPAQ